MKKYIGITVVAVAVLASTALVASANMRHHRMAVHTPSVMHTTSPSPTTANAMGGDVASATDQNDNINTGASAAKPSPTPLAAVVTAVAKTINSVFPSAPVISGGGGSVTGGQGGGSTVTPKPSSQPSNSPAATPTPGATPSTTPSATPSPSVSPTPSITPTPSASPTPSVTPTPSPSATPTPTPTPVPVANLVANPSVETSNGVNPANFTSAVDNAQTVATFGYLTSGHTGSRSLQTTVSAVGGTFPGAQWSADPINVVGGKQYSFSDYYQASVDTEVDVEYTNTSGVSSFLAVVGKASASTGWAKFTGTFTVPADAKSVTVYHVLSTVGTLTTDDYSLSTYVPVGFSRGLVSFTFDDAWKNIFTYGLPIFTAEGIHTTQYLLSGPTQNNDPDYMSLADMQALRDQGSEIAAHTVNHYDLTTLGSTPDPQRNNATIDTELNDSKLWLQTNLGVSVDDFATPYGAYNTNVLAEIAKYYAYHRSTDEGFNSKDNLNFYNIKVQNILSTTTQAQVQGWVNQATADHTWLVLVYHQVTPTAPTSTDVDPVTGAVVPDIYWTTPSDLTAEIEYAKTKASATGVVSVHEAINEIKPQL